MPEKLKVFLSGLFFIMVGILIMRDKNKDVSDINWFMYKILGVFYIAVSIVSLIFLLLGV